MSDEKESAKEDGSDCDSDSDSMSGSSSESDVSEGVSPKGPRDVKEDLKSVMSAINAGHTDSLVAIASSSLYGKLPRTVNAVMMYLDLKGFKLRCTYRLNEGTAPETRKSSSSVPSTSASDIDDVRQRKPLKALQSLAPRRVGKTAIKVLDINFPAPISPSTNQNQTLEHKIRKALSEMSGLSLDTPIKRVLSETELFVNEKRKKPEKKKKRSSHKKNQSPTSISTNEKSSETTDVKENFLFSLSKKIFPIDWYEQVTSIATPSLLYWILIPSHLYILYVVTYYENVPRIFYLHEKVAYFLFRSTFVLQIIFILAILIHLSESLYSFYICKKKGIRKPFTIFLWTLQTLMLGYPSLRKLLEVPDDKLTILE